MDQIDSGRDLDIALFGATGFVGRLIAGHLAQHAPDGVRIGLAGRSPGKLERLRDDLGVDWPLIEVDAADEVDVAALAARSRVVATTVGPYAKYGMPLVEACAAAGTHYCDLTGEVLFVRDTIDRFATVAEQTGARIVHACGFDSVPSDLGVLATAQAAEADGEGDLTETVLRVRSLKGGLSGGTIDSMRQQAIDTRADAGARRVAMSRYSLSDAPPKEATPHASGEPTPSGAAGLAQKVARGIPVRRAEDGHWTGPFVMAAFNTRIVRRSNELLDWAYGTRFRYNEVSDFGTSPTAPLAAAGMTAGLLGVVGGMSFGPTRKALDRVLPSPGEGPSEETRNNGRFRMDIAALTTTGARYRTVFSAEHDPGYNGTAIMFGEAALCLAVDEDRLPERAGVLTPASAMGEVLTDRLRAQGFTIETSRLGD